MAKTGSFVVHDDAWIAGPLRGVNERPRQYGDYPPRSWQERLQQQENLAWGHQSDGGSSRRLRGYVLPDFGLAVAQTTSGSSAATPFLGALLTI